jgi:L-malate glycosyltransferase
MGEHMLLMSKVSNNIYVVRVVFEFYPVIGGSISHIIELSKKIDPYLKKQIIIAPSFNENCINFDSNFGIKVSRVKLKPFRKVSIFPTLPLTYILYSLRVYNELNKMKRPDVIHAHGLFNIVSASLIGKYMGIPVVGMLHGSADAYSKIAGLCETFLALLFKPDHCFVLDDGSLLPEKFQKLWGNRVTVVYHGIDTNVYKQMEKNYELMSKLGISNSDFIILSTSSLLPLKNIDLAIKAFKLFINITSFKSVHLLIAGGGPMKSNLIKLTDALGLNENVLFLDYISKDDILKYISISDVIIATSLYSNMNRSIQEAMSCGKPIITFDCGNISSLVKHKENGILVKSGDLDSFAQNIKLLSEDIGLRTTLGKQARETILNQRNWNKRIQQELELYNKIINPR